MSEWHPIDTAKRSIKEPDIILFARFEDQGGGFIEDIRIGRWVSCTGPHGLIDGWESDEGVHPEGYFSYWMPLPASPNKP